MMYPLINIEGIDGAGKTALCDELQTKDNVVVLRSPGGTTVGEYLREKILYSPLCSDVTRRLMFLLCDALVKDRLLTDIDLQGRIIIGDRSLLSNIVYDASSDIDTVINTINNLGLNFPDYIIWLKTDPKVALGRLRLRDPSLKDETSFLQRYIDQGTLPVTATVVDMLEMLHARYQTVIYKLKEKHLVTRVAVIPTEIDKPYESAVKFIQGVVDGNT